MPQTAKGLEQALFQTFRESYADEFASVLARESPFDTPDPEKYDKLRRTFLKAVDTPEKLGKLAEARTPPPCSECGRD